MTNKPEWMLTDEEIHSVFEAGGTADDYFNELCILQAKKLLEYLKVHPSLFNKYTEQAQGISLDRIDSMLKELKEM